MASILENINNEEINSVANLSLISEKDKQILQGLVVGLDTSTNTTFLPATGLSANKKALETTSKIVTKAINEINTLLKSNNTTVSGFGDRFNSVIGSEITNPELLTQLHEIDENLLKAVIKVAGEVNDLSEDFANFSPDGWNFMNATNVTANSFDIPNEYMYLQPDAYVGLGVKVINESSTVYAIISSVTANVDHYVFTVNGKELFTGTFTGEVYIGIPEKVVQVDLSAFGTFAETAAPTTDIIPTYGRTRFNWRMAKAHLVEVQTFAMVADTTTQPTIDILIGASQVFSTTPISIGEAVTSSYTDHVINKGDALGISVVTIGTKTAEDLTASFTFVLD